MEGFTYNNIFETKGIEYIIIIMFLSLLVPVYFIISRQGSARNVVAKVVQVLTSAALRVPQGLFFSKNHTWVYMQPSGMAKVGLDDFMVKVIGKMQLVPLKSKGDQVNKGDVLAEIKQNGKLLKIHSPITGRIANTNIPAGNDPASISDDPYGTGWFYEVKPENWKAETAEFYLAGEAENWLDREISRFKDFLATSVNMNSGLQTMPAFQEGGELRVHVMEEMQPEVWTDFQKEFLDQ